MKRAFKYSNRNAIWQYTLEAFRKYTSINLTILELYPDEIYSYVYLKMLYAVLITNLGNLNIWQWEIN